MLDRAEEFHFLFQPLLVRGVGPRVVGQLLDEKPPPRLGIFAAPDAPDGVLDEGVKRAEIHGVDLSLEAFAGWWSGWG